MMKNSIILRNEGYGGTLFNQGDGAFMRVNHAVFNTVLRGLVNQSLTPEENTLYQELLMHFPLDSAAIKVNLSKTPRATTPSFSHSPELIDWSILSTCNAACEFCYMSSTTDGEYLSLPDFHYGMEELAKNRVFQVAIGGGEPLLHPQFPEIIESMRNQYDIIPNYTTNGILLDDAVCRLSEVCGAIAISYHPSRSKMLLKRARLLQQHNLNTTLHVVVMRDNFTRIADIIQPYCQAGVNSIALLLFKPMGRGQTLSKQILHPQDIPTLLDELPRIYEVVNQYDTILGFDSCFAPFLTHLTLPRFIYDACDAARFVAHIDWHLNVRPCSYMDLDEGMNLKTYSLQEIWWGDWFTQFRDRLLTPQQRCSRCPSFSSCLGGCPYLPEITLCKQ